MSFMYFWIFFPCKTRGDLEANLNLWSFNLSSFGFALFSSFANSMESTTNFHLPIFRATPFLVSYFEAPPKL